ncbi:MAG: tetratricopeptide repeat protein [Acidobacteriota bacterium]
MATAPRNLVVHRDLKPANILVDQHGDVRVLDFGVAKLLDTGATLEVETTRVLTPGYGAPEQRVGDAITTATDVYGIGAVAYRLLSGTRPNDAPLPAPSSGADAVDGIDADLDNIVRMATRVEPRDRYPSVDALAEDLRRWRAGLPIRATPDRLPYRLRKFVARHRTAVFAGLAVIVSLLVGSGVALHQATIARQEAERSRLAEAEAKQHLARAILVSDFLEATFRAADPASSGPEEITAREILDAGSRWIETSLHEAPEVEAQLRSILAQVSFSLGDLDRVEQLLAPSLAASAPSPTIRPAEADRRLMDAVTAARLAAQRGQAELAQERFDAAFRLAPSASLDGRLDAELRYCTTLVDLRSGAVVVERLETLLRDGTLAEAGPARQAQTYMVLAAAYDQVGRFDDARRLGEAALDGFRAIDRSGGGRLWRGRWLAEQAGVRAILANIEANRGALDRALELAQASLESRLQLLGPKHPNVLVQRNDVATYFKNLGRFDESAAMLDALLLTQQEVLGDAHPYLAYSHFNLGEALARAADHAEDPPTMSTRALEHYRRAVERLRALPPAHQGPLPIFRAVYGHALGRAGQSARGESELRDALAGFSDDDPPLIASRLQVLYAEFLSDRGRQGEALDRTNAAVERLAEGYGAGSRHHALALLQHGRALEPTDPNTAREVLTDAVEALRASPFHRQYARELQAGDAALARLAGRAR